MDAEREIERDMAPLRDKDMKGSQQVERGKTMKEKETEDKEDTKSQKRKRYRKTRLNLRAKREERSDTS